MANLYKRNLDLISADLDDDLVVLDVEQGKYFSLNPISKRIWEILEEEKSKEELVAILLDEYDVSSEECNRDVEIHLKELKKMKLIH